MGILKLLPKEIKSRVFLFMSHPTADLIQDRLEELKLNRSIQITVMNPSFEFDLDFRDFLETEHFEALKHFREFQSYDGYEYLDALEMIKSLTWIR
jgi:hypothetical protein